MQSARYGAGSEGLVRSKESRGVSPLSLPVSQRYNPKASRKTKGLLLWRNGGSFVFTLRLALLSWGRLYKCHIQTLRV